MMLNDQSVVQDVLCLWLSAVTAFRSAQAVRRQQWSYLQRRSNRFVSSSAIGPEGNQSETPCSNLKLPDKRLKGKTGLRCPHSFQLLHWPALIELRYTILQLKTTILNTISRESQRCCDQSHPALIIAKTDGSHITQFTSWSARSGQISAGGVPAAIFWPVTFMYTSPQGSLMIVHFAWTSQDWLSGVTVRWRESLISSGQKKGMTLQPSWQRGGFIFGRASCKASSSFSLDEHDKNMKFVVQNPASASSLLKSFQPGIASRLHELCMKATRCL